MIFQVERPDHSDVRPQKIEGEGNGERRELGEGGGIEGKGGRGGGTGGIGGLKLYSGFG